MSKIILHKEDTGEEYFYFQQGTPIKELRAEAQEAIKVYESDKIALQKAKKDMQDPDEQALCDEKIQKRTDRINRLKLI